MFLINILYSVSYAYYALKNIQGTQANISVNTLTISQFLPEYPEVGRVQSAYLNSVGQNVQFSAFF